MAKGEAAEFATLKHQKSSINGLVNPLVASAGGQNSISSMLMQGILSTV